MAQSRTRNATSDRCERVLIIAFARPDATICAGVRFAAAAELGQVEPQRAARLRIVARDDPGQRDQSPPEWIEPALRVLEHSRRPPGEHPARVVALLRLDDGPPATLANGRGAGSGRILADLARHGARGLLRTAAGLGGHPHGIADKQGIRRHDGEIVGTGKMMNLQQNKQNADEVNQGNECGIVYEGTIKVEVGDTLICYKEEERKRKL
jgi:hypothetical protein